MNSKNNFDRFISLFFLSVTFVFTINCSSNKSLNKNSVNPKNVIVISHNDSLPPKSKFIENLKMGYFPPYISQYKNYDSLIVDAKQKVAEMGGNILQIISHSPYQLNFEKKDLNLHKIKAKVFYSDYPIEILPEEKINFVENEIILNFYMLDQGPLVKKDIYINDSIAIKNFKSKSKSQYKIEEPGTYIFKFGKNGIPLKLELKENQIYYLKCYMKIEGFWNKSAIEEVKDSKEYDSY